MVRACWPGLLAGLLASCAVLAQVSGEILVGRATSPTASNLVPGLRAPEAPVPAALPGSLAEPEPIVLPQPVYPRAARAARQGGRVMVCFTLDERGFVHTPAVRASTDPVFNQPVLDAINAARFSPARVGQQAVRSTACRTFRFVLR
jgi:TonB family protein